MANRAGTKLAAGLVLALLGAGLSWAGAGQDQPPELNPFGPATKAGAREDAVPGYVELSDGTIRPGRIYLTRDARLKIFDAKTERQREVPLNAIRKLDGTIDREWLEPEWRFKENANDEKVYTGRSYPSREYVHAITLRDGRTIRGPLSALLYVAPENGGEPEKFLLHKRDKGPAGTTLKSLVYVRAIRLGDDALSEGKQKQKARTQKSKGPRK
jgi:hypothetical protein